MIFLNLPSTILSLYRTSYTSFAAQKITTLSNQISILSLECGLTLSHGMVCASIEIRSRDNLEGAKRGCFFTPLIPQHGLIEAERGKVDILSRGQLVDIV